MGAFVVLRGLAERARAGAARRRTTKRALDVARGALAPGVWVPVGRSAWTRAGSVLPPHFGGNPRVRGTLATRLAARAAGDGSDAAGRRRLVRTLRLAAEAALPPWVRLEPPRRRGELPTGFTVALPTEPIGSGRAVLLDPAGARVLRLVAGPLDPEYLELRARLAGHFAVAPVLDVGASWLEEALVRGDDFASQPEGTQRRVIRSVFRAATALLAAEGRPGPTHEDLRWSERFATVPRPAWFERLLDGARIDDLLRAGPIVPIHGDLGGHNLLLVDGDPVLFDLDPRMLRWGPFWFDVVHWMHPRVPLPHRTWFRAGGFDAEVAELCRAAGWPSARPEVARGRLTALLIGRTLVEEHPEVGEDPAGDAALLDRLGRTLEVVG